MQQLIDKEFPGENIKYQRIPCGKCIGCRLDYSKNWATRCVLEASQWEHNWFITLTYDEDHLPKWENGEYCDKNGLTWIDETNEWQGYLKPEDMTLFLKRLRKYYKDHFDIPATIPDQLKDLPKEELPLEYQGIRFFYCGEYGGAPHPLYKDRVTGQITYSQGFRPHYHVIFFNLPIPLNELQLDKESSKSGKQQFKCKFIEDIWGKGRIRISEVNWQTCAYTARYITKKVTGEPAAAHYGRMGQTPEFVRMSRMPGIARQYYELHKDEIYNLDEIVMKLTGEKSLAIKPPKYYDKLYDIEYPNRMAEIKDIRRTNAEEAAKVKASTTTLTQLKQLNIEEDIKRDQLKKLKRDL